MTGTETEHRLTETHSFVVRLWREVALRESRAREWRGVIIHTATGAYDYFRSPGRIVRFIRTYLDKT